MFLAETVETGTKVVYHLPQIPGNFGWDVDGKRFFFLVPLENSRDKRKFWNGSPVFPVGTFRMEIGLPFTSFLSFVLQSTLALRTPRYYGQPANADKSQPPGETLKEMTKPTPYYGL